MNTLYEKIATASDEEIMQDIKEALDEVDPSELGETLAELLESLEEGRIDALKQIGAIDRLSALIRRYQEEVLKNGV